MKTIQILSLTTSCNCNIDPICSNTANLANEKPHLRSKQTESMKPYLCQVQKVTSKTTELKADVWTDILGLKATKLMFVSVGWARCPADAKLSLIFSKRFCGAPFIGKVAQAHIWERPRFWKWTVQTSRHTVKSPPSLFLVCHVFASFYDGNTDKYVLLARA